jgi:hypothetical protein
MDDREGTTRPRTEGGEPQPENNSIADARFHHFELHAKTALHGLSAVGKKFLDEARAKGMLIAYATGATGKRTDILAELAPTDSELLVSTGVDKFFNTDLEKILKEGGTQTVIAIGTAAQGAVLYTASAAALRGMKVIVPVDGMSDSPYSEQYTAWHLANAPVVSRNVTLTKFDLIKF